MSRVTTAPAPTSADWPTVTPPMMVQLLPRDALALMRVSRTFQSASDCKLPSVLTALGYASLMNMTPWPTNTPSSIVTPEQIKLWLEILQLAPMEAPRCTSTNAPTFVPSPILQPYRLTRSRSEERSV